MMTERGPRHVSKVLWAAVREDGMRCQGAIIGAMVPAHSRDAGQGMVAGELTGSC